MLRLITAVRPLRAAALALQLLHTIGPRSALARARQAARRRRLNRVGSGSLLLEMWTEAADELGASTEPLGGGRLLIRKGEISMGIDGHALPLNGTAELALARDKRQVATLLRDDGIPVPPGERFTTHDIRPAIRFLERADGGVVVKPAVDTGGGLGVTGGVRTPRDLWRAALKASRAGHELLVERQLPGRVLRLLVLDGELLDVVARDLPAVTGDGRSSVGRLMHLENDRRLARMGEGIEYLLRPDLDTVLALREQGRSLHTVPAKGERVRVKSITSQNGRTDNETFRDDLAEGLVSEVRRAVELTGLRLAGVDVVTPDPARSLAVSGGAILEVNGEPGLVHHRQVANPDAATQVAVPILRAILKGRDAGDPMAA